MNNNCGVITARRTPCLLDKNSCRYHSHLRILSPYAKWKAKYRHKFTNDLGQYVCGALLTGHGRSHYDGERCRNIVRYPTDVCISHRWTTMKQRTIIDYRGSHLRKQLHPKRSLKQ